MIKRILSPRLGLTIESSRGKQAEQTSLGAVYPS